jgi:hypothetical protein
MILNMIDTPLRNKTMMIKIVDNIIITTGYMNIESFNFCTNLLNLVFTKTTSSSFDLCSVLKFKACLYSCCGVNIVGDVRGDVRCRRLYISIH